METIQDGHQTQLFKKLKTPKSLHADSFSFHSSYKHNVIFTFTKDFVVIMLFLDFIVLFTFYACKNDTSNISNQHQTQISPSTNHLVTVKIDTYTNSMGTFKTLPLLKVEP